MYRMESASGAGINILIGLTQLAIKSPPPQGEGYGGGKISNCVNLILIIIGSVVKLSSQASNRPTPVIPAKAGI